MFSRKKTPKGFTLMEVLVVIFLLAVVLVTLISVFIYGFNLLSRIKQVAIAAQIAQEEVERVRNNPFDQIDGSTFSQGSLDLLSSPPFQKGQGSLTVEQDPEDTENNIRKLTVTATWEYRGRPMKKQVVTYITRDGIDKR